MHPLPGEPGKSSILLPSGTKHNITTEYQETDEDREFLDMIDLEDVDRTYLENALEKFEETSFDPFNFNQVLPGHGI